MKPVSVPPAAEAAEPVSDCPPPDDVAAKSETSDIPADVPPLSVERGESIPLAPVDSSEPAIPEPEPIIELVSAPPPTEPDGHATDTGIV